MSTSILPPTVKSIGLSTKGRRKPQMLMAAARHNLREIQKEMGAGGDIDAARVHLNEIMAGPDTASGVVALAAQMMEDIGYKPSRKDYTQAHEMLFTLGKRTPVCASDYFAWCLEFTRGRFGAGSILSAVIHRDGDEEHLHILIAPISSGAYLGSALITKPSLAELVDDYAAEVWKVFGLEAVKKLDAKMRKQVSQAVHKGLRAALEGRIDADLMDALLKLAEGRPTVLMEVLGITLPGLSDRAGDNGAEFRRIALSTGKGRKKEREQKPYGFEGATKTIQKPYGFEVAEFEGNQKPYGFEIDQKSGAVPAAENDQNHTCVGFAQKAQSISTATPPTAASRMKATRPQTVDGHRVTSWDDQPDQQPDDDPTTSDRTNWDDDPTPTQSDDDEWAGSDYRSDNHNDHNQQERTSWD